MSAPILPVAPSGPAGEYVEAVKARTLRAIEWFGLDPADLLSFDLNTLTLVAFDKKVEATRGVVGSWSVSHDGEFAKYTAQLHLTLTEGDELWAHVGPPPEPALLISIWNARAEDLRPGAWLYNAGGNVIGQVGQRIPRPALGGFEFLVKT